MSAGLAFSGPKYSFSCESREASLGQRTTLRTYLTIGRKGGKWNLEIPGGEEVKNLSFDEKNFDETDEGFSLFFGWGGGRWFQDDTLFFKDDGSEPVLYKIQSRTDEYGRTKSGDFDLIEQQEEVSEINPPVKISRLGANKINLILAGVYKSLPKVTCPDSDYDKPIKDKIMHIEVSREGKIIQKLEYAYGENPHGLFGLSERFEPVGSGLEKHFELVDLNFDGYDDILILAGLTMNGAQPFYDAYFWNEGEGQFELNPPCWEEPRRTYIKCDEINRLLYASWNTTRGLIYYYIYEYDEANQKYILTGRLFYNYPNDLYSENEKYEHWSEKWDFKDPTVIEFEELSERWKSAVEFKGFSF